MPLNQDGKILERRIKFFGNVAAPGNYGNWGIVNIRGTSYAWNFNVSDFVELISVKLLFFAGANWVNANIDFWVGRIEEGEAFNAHVASDLASVYALTAGVLDSFDLTALIETVGLVDDCWAFVRALCNDAVDVQPIGLQVEYWAEWIKP